MMRSLLALLPESVASAVGSLLGVVAGSVFKIRRADVDRNLSVAFPEESERWRADVARRSYQHIGREAVSIFRGRGWTQEKVLERTRMIGFEEFCEVAQTGAVVALTGHVGNWELAAASGAARGLEVNVVAKGMANRRFEADLLRNRQQLGMHVIKVGDARRGVLGALRQGGIVGILGDQDARRTGVFVPFFGKLASTARGPALFALRAEAPVYLVVALRVPGRRPTYEVSFSRIEFTPTGELDKDIHDLTKRYMLELESVVRNAPEQYFWPHRRWKSRPPEEQERAAEVTNA
jgi:KDO2-lipid IV(A) lauroyltransferase